MAAVSVSPEERRAAELLVEMLGAERWTARDAHGADARTHDLDLEMRDGSVIAVEVTRDASGADWALDTALTKHPIEAPGLAAVWRVWVTPRCQAKELPKELPGLLAEMEKGERHNWVSKPPKRSDSDPCLDSKLQELGVWHARRCELDEQGPRVLLRPADLPGSTGAAAIPDAVQRHVEGNRCKLLRARDSGEASEAHLFIWLQLDQPNSAAGAGPGELNSVDLQGIDAAWVTVDCAPPAPVYRFKSGCWTRWPPWRATPCQPRATAATAIQTPADHTPGEAPRTGGQETRQNRVS